MDDEPYHDADFDVDNPESRKLQKELEEEYNFGKKFKHNDKKGNNRKYGQDYGEGENGNLNALFDDDQVDQKDYGSSLPKHNFGKTHLQGLNKKGHVKIEENHSHLKAFNTGENVEPTSDRIKRKLERKVVPLPYDITSENRFEIIKDLIMPLHNQPYGEQLKHKFDKIMSISKALGDKIKMSSSPIRIGASGCAFPVESVRASPRTEQYRNKDEFSIWPGIDGNTKTVGFFVGQPSLHDRVVCVEPEPITISPQSHRELVRKVQNYLQHVSPYDSCLNYGLGGNWRRVHIRSNQAGHHMLTMIMHPQQLTQDELTQEMNRIRNYFDDDERIKSLYFHASRHTRSTHTHGEPYVLLSGDQVITETLFAKSERPYLFNISPSSFFQVRLEN